MKKLTVSILIIAIILNLIQPIVLYASDPPANESYTTNSYKGIVEDGVANITAGGVKRAESTILSTTGSAIGANLIALIGNAIATVFIGAVSTVIRDDANNITYNFSIHDAVFNKIKLFDANYLTEQKDNYYTVGGAMHDRIQKQVAVWYYNIRNVAIALSLCMLIYVGIRMAISTISDDKAKYKKMLIGWLQSFVLIFFMHYIILISMVVSDKLVEIIRGLSTNGIVELRILENAWGTAMNKPGWDCIPSSILYWVLVFYQVKFFMLYIKRALAVAFLIIISPLITVTYSIDKIGDGKAQAFNSWIKEFEVNMFIQPLHGLLYGIFIVSAGKLAEVAPLLAVVFFMALSRGEKIIKGIFNTRGMKSISSMGKGGGKKK